MEHGRIRKIYLSVGIFLVIISMTVVAFGVIYKQQTAKPTTTTVTTAANTPGGLPTQASADVQQVIKSQSAVGAAVSTTVVVKLKKGTSQATLDALNQKLGVTQVTSIAPLGAHVVSIPANVNVSDVIKSYQSQGIADYAEQNYLVKSFLTPDDPLYSQEWNLAKIAAPSAWDGSQISSGPIAVIDTGVDAAHADLKGEILPGYNFVANSTDTSDDNGHGTHVAGIIEAATNNGTGVASIGFHGSILPVKVLDSQGTGTYADVANGILYAVDHGAKIINMSLGGPSFSQTLEDAVNYATSHGVIVIAAAGNTGSNSPEYPAALPGVLAVSATDSGDNIASFSSFGSDIFASAPGVNITSTFNNGGYASLSGTSMAAPHLAGLVGLALGYANANHLSLSSSQLIDDLKKTSDKVGSRPYNTSGWNQYYGYGRIDALKLLDAIQPIASPSPTPTQTTVSPSPTTTTSSPTPTTTETTTASPAPTPSPTTTTPTAKPTPTTFPVELEATVSSVDQQNTKLTVELVSNNNAQLVLSKGDLVDVFVTPQTLITRGGTAIALGDLQPSEQIHIVATWSDNKLTASQLILQKQIPAPPTATSEPPTDTPSSTPTTTQTTPIAPSPTSTNPSNGHSNNASNADKGQSQNNDKKNTNTPAKQGGH